MQSWGFQEEAVAAVVGWGPRISSQAPCEFRTCLAPPQSRKFISWYKKIYFKLVMINSYISVINLLNLYLLLVVSLNTDQNNTLEKLFY